MFTNVLQTPASSLPSLLVLPAPPPPEFPALSLLTPAASSPVTESPAPEAPPARVAPADPSDACCDSAPDPQPMAAVTPNKTQQVDSLDDGSSVYTLSLTRERDGVTTFRPGRCMSPR